MGRAETNKFGLSRNIPKNIKREIRRRCGYGCVLCGSAIYTYEHIEPTFEDAREHNPDNIALLCGACHLNVTKGIWSKEKVISGLKNPAAYRQGFSKFEMDVASTGDFILKVGNTEFVNLEKIIEIDGNLILGIKPPEAPNTPPRVNAKFYDRESNFIAGIVDNEWQGSIDSFDIEAIGNKFKIRSDLRQIDLLLSITPPNLIVIERLNLCFNEKRIQGSIDKGFHIISERSATTIPPDKKRVEKAPYWINLTDVLMLGTDSAMSHVSDGLHHPLPGVIGHHDVKVEYLDPSEGPNIPGRPKSRPMKITSMKGGGYLSIEVDLPNARIKKQLLEQSPESVKKLFEDIERFAGKEIAFAQRSDIGNWGMASSTSEFGATIFYRDHVIRPQAFAHALLYIHQYWIQKLPEIQAKSDPNGDNSFVTNYIENSLANLTILPMLSKYGFDAYSDQDDQELANWKKFDPSKCDKFTIRMRCLLGWFNTVNTTDNPLTISTAEKIINKLGYRQKAKQLNYRLLKHAGQKEKQISCIVKYLKIPIGEAKLVYFNPKDETRIEKEIERYKG